jgi:hypothetical protein
MKKSYLSIIILTLILSFNFSCDSDNQEFIEETNSIDNLLKVDEENSGNSSRKALSFCKIDGPTSACSGQTVTYTYSTDLTISNIVWSVTSGNLTLISGQGTNTAIFQIGSPFSGGWVQAYGSGSPDCFASIQILKCGSGGGNDTCACPSPIIDDVLCVSGGHPHWRFEVYGVSSSDQITWSINHGTVHSGANGGTYAIIEPNAGSTYGFTVFCKVVRTCADGTKKERTAYYTNYYGNSCGTGSTGFTTSCNSGGGLIDDPYLP